jgi:hypothetical protein
MKPSISSSLARVVVCAAIGLLAVGAHAADEGQTKDIVLDLVTARPAGASAASQPAGPASDAMVVSILVESPNGQLTPRSVNSLFNSGERFRVKVRASRDGKIALYNTKPNGELVAKPLWRGDVSRGLEIIAPRLRIEGTSGTDQLHIVLEPAKEPGVFAWLGNWLGGKSKDIRLDTANTTSDTYLLGNPGKGLVTTLNITHR